MSRLFHICPDCFTFHILGAVEVCALGVLLVYLRCLFSFLTNTLSNQELGKHWHDDLWSMAYFTIGCIETWHRYWWTQTPQHAYRLKLELNNLTKESILTMHFSKHLGGTGLTKAANELRLLHYYIHQLECCVRKDESIIMLQSHTCCVITKSISWYK